MKVRKCKGRCVAAISLLLLGCDARETRPNGAQASEEKSFVAGAAHVRGVVRFVGRPPVMGKIENRPCHDDATTPLTEETVIVNPNGTLANVLVWIEGAGRMSSAEAARLKPALLDQVSCRYVPHVLGAVAGQSVTLRSSDATMHNVHYRPARNDAANWAMTGAGQEKVVTFNEPEPDPMRLKCDVHPWMAAYIGVQENPLFDVTGADGAFEIADVPSGTYNLVAWHEQYGRREQPVSISEGRASVDVSFEFKGQSMAP